MHDDNQDGQDQGDTQVENINLVNDALTLGHNVE